VVWGKDLPSGELNFFSVSEDGTVCQWLLVEFEMVKIVIMTLIIEMDPEIELGGIKQTYYGNIDLHIKSVFTRVLAVVRCDVYL
jgi:dynein intermediate chain 1